MEIRKINVKDRRIIEKIVKIHLETFKGFFLTFMGKGFLTCLYKSYCQYDESGLLVAFEGTEPIGFLAYSGDYSGLYKFMIKKKLIPFAWYSVGAFFRSPKSFIRILRAFKKSDDVKREDKYIELASIGVKPEQKSMGVGSALIDELKHIVAHNNYAYISLETDADNNIAVNKFYQKNGFILARTYKTREGRNMNEYNYIFS